MARGITIVKPHRNEHEAILPFEDKIHSRLLEAGFAVCERNVEELREYIIKKRREAISRGFGGINVERVFEFFLGLKDIENRLSLMLEEFSRGNAVIELHAYEDGGEGMVLIIPKQEFISLVKKKLQNAKKLLVYGFAEHSHLGLFGIEVESEVVDFDALAKEIFGKKLSKLIESVGLLLKNVSAAQNTVLAVEIAGKRELVAGFEDIYGDHIDQIINDTSEYERNYILSKLCPLDEEERLNVEEVAEAVCSQIKPNPSSS